MTAAPLHQHDVMKKINLTTAGLAVTVFVGLSAVAPVHVAEGQTRGVSRAQPYGGSLDPWQHGYEHAYRDGADQGRQDRDRKMAYSWRNNDYFGARSYEPAFGDRNQYMDGYRQGYQAGYDDGYYGLAGQYGQVYARPQAGLRVPPANDPYADRQFGATDMAYDAGYREGVTLAQQDRGRNARSNFRASTVYRNGDLGYRASYGNRDQYRLQFRDGIERGYTDGYDRSQNSGVGGTIAGDTRGYANGGRTAAGGRTAGTAGTAAGGTIIVPANRQWTPTGIRVTQGEVLRFASSGEVHFSGNAADRAGVAGSPDHKFVGGSPLPNALAGALIGRIDNGLPFGIGDQTTITAPASGLLYLGTNDDIVTDNSGQFQVIISFGR
jgi:hypothetical protein